MQDEVKVWHIEVLKLLPITLGVRTSISSKGFIMPDTGVGGKAISPDLLHLGFQSDFSDGISKQVANARSVYYHENFHIAQMRHARQRGGVVNTAHSAIEAAILEGGGTQL